VKSDLLQIHVENKWYLLVCCIEETSVSPRLVAVFMQHYE